MSNIKIFIAKVKSVLDAISPTIGKVYGYEPLARDWPDYLSLFKVSPPPTPPYPQIAGWIITRSKTIEEPGAVKTNKRTNTILIRGIFSLDEKGASGEVFQDNIEKICDAFRPLYNLDGLLLTSSPIQVDVVDVRKFGDILCHYCELSIAAVEEIQWT